MKCLGRYSSHSRYAAGVALLHSDDFIDFNAWHVQNPDRNADKSTDFRHAGVNLKLQGERA
jgi:hypothetical protein